MFDKSWGISEAVLTVSPGSTTSMSKVTFYPIGKTEGARS